VRELKGAKYYNDTAATTPDSAIRGIQSFSEPMILICGGSDKNLDMERFSLEALQRAKSIIFLKGPATDKMISSMKQKDARLGDDEFKIAQSMEEAVGMAGREAEEGDVVLLSPGAASFGMFLNEFDRGDKFKEAVKKLK
jgi:UDP-N-acetylmuramoylalanine--D-glutamate ligase